MIHYNVGSTFWCESCSKMVKGEGYLYYGKPVCAKHYKEIFPKWEEGQHELQQP